MASDYVVLYLHSHEYITEWLGIATSHDSWGIKSGEVS